MKAIFPGFPLVEGNAKGLEESAGANETTEPGKGFDALLALVASQSASATPAAQPVKPLAPSVGAQAMTAPLATNVAPVPNVLDESLTRPANDLTVYSIHSAIFAAALEAQPALAPQPAENASGAVPAALALDLAPSQTSASPASAHVSEPAAQPSSQPSLVALEPAPALLVSTPAVAPALQAPVQALVSSEHEAQPALPVASTETPSVSAAPLPAPMEPGAQQPPAAHAEAAPQAQQPLAAHAEAAPQAQQPAPLPSAVAAALAPAAHELVQADAPAAAPVATAPVLAHDAPHAQENVQLPATAAAPTPYAQVGVVQPPQATQQPAVAQPVHEIDAPSAEPARAAKAKRAAHEAPDQGTEPAAAPVVATLPMTMPLQAPLAPAPAAPVLVSQPTVAAVQTAAAQPAAPAVELELPSAAELPAHAADKLGFDAAMRDSLLSAPVAAPTTAATPVAPAPAALGATPAPVVVTEPAAMAQPAPQPVAVSPASQAQAPVAAPRAPELSVAAATEQLLGMQDLETGAKVTSVQFVQTPAARPADVSSAPTRSVVGQRTAPQLAPVMQAPAAELTQAPELGAPSPSPASAAAEEAAPALAPQLQDAALAPEGEAQELPGAERELDASQLESASSEAQQEAADEQSSEGQGSQTGQHAAHTPAAPVFQPSEGQGMRGLDAIVASLLRTGAKETDAGPAQSGPVRMTNSAPAVVDTAKSDSAKSAERLSLEQGALKQRALSRDEEQKELRSAGELELTHAFAPEFKADDPAPGADAAPAAPTTPTQVVQDPDAAMMGKLARGEGVNAAAISIDHPEFGAMDLMVENQNGKIDVRAVLETPRAAAVMRAQESALRYGIQQAGMTFGALRVRARGEEPAPLKARENLKARRRGEWEA